MWSFSTLNRSFVYIYPPCDFMSYEKNVNRLKIYYSFEKNLSIFLFRTIRLLFMKKNDSN